MKFHLFAQTLDIAAGQVSQIFRRINRVLKIILLIAFLAINGISAGRLKRLVGGAPISIEEAPYFVSIEKKCRHYCGGSLITSRHVLTAGHCFPADIEELDKYHYSAVVGSDRMNIGGTCHAIKNVIRPDTFVGKILTDDVAVVALSETVKIGPTVRPIPLPIDEVIYYSDGTVIGFQSNKSAERKLYRQEVALWPSEFCLDDNSPHIYTSEGQICGVHSCDEETTYFGDSGGPLVCEGIVVGVASWFSQTGLCNSYYADVYFHLRFIREAIRS